MRLVDLYPALGSEANVIDLTLILDIIDRVWWDQVPVENQPERDDSATGYNQSLGRSDPHSGNWVWYNPCEGSLISRKHAFALRDVPRTVPIDDPTGFVYAEDYDYEPPLDLDDPTLGSDVNPLGGAFTVVPAPSGSGNACASGSGSMAPAGWNFGTPQSVGLAPQAASVRQGILGVGIPILPGMTDLNQMLAFAASYQQSQNTPGAPGPSSGFS